MPKRRGATGKPCVFWNVPKLISRLGGIEPAVDAHRAYGFDPLTYKQVSMWRLRGKAPAERLIELFAVLKRIEGNHVDLWEYVQEREE